MNNLKMIGMIFLAVYLILMGLATMSEVLLSPMANYFANLFGVASGVFILISIGKFLPKK